MFDHTNKRYMHSTESLPENEIHKLHWEFEIQKTYLISARRPDLVIINKKKRTCRIVDITVLAYYREGPRTLSETFEWH